MRFGNLLYVYALVNLDIFLLRATFGDLPQEYIKGIDANGHHRHLVEREPLVLFE